MNLDSGFKIPDKSSKFFFPMTSDFPCDVFSVFFDGKLGEVEFFGNFLGGVTLLDLGNNFELTEGKISYSDMR
nr:hypothetical protein [Aquirufa ecclesiirivi]